jgi:hypothetical protein
LFQDIELNEDLINEFQRNSLEGVKEFENLTEYGVKNEDIVSENVMDSDDSIISEEEEPVPVKESVETNHTTMFDNKYEKDIDLPTVANRFADIIIDFEKSKGIEERNDDDFIVEYNDVSFDSNSELQETTNQVQQGDLIYLSEDEIDVVEELFDDYSENVRKGEVSDEIFFSDEDDYGDYDAEQDLNATFKNPFRPLLVLNQPFP